MSVWSRALPRSWVGWSVDLRTPPRAVLSAQQTLFRSGSGSAARKRGHFAGIPPRWHWTATRKNLLTSGKSGADDGNRTRVFQLGKLFPGSNGLSIAPGQRPYRLPRIPARRAVLVPLAHGYGTALVRLRFGRVGGTKGVLGTNRFKTSRSGPPSPHRLVIASACRRVGARCSAWTLTPTRVDCRAPGPRTPRTVHIAWLE